MKSRRRGIMLLINNMQYDNKIEPKLSHRAGSDVDAQNLNKLFSELHFDVRLANNLTSQVCHKNIYVLITFFLNGKYVSIDIMCVELV